MRKTITAVSVDFRYNLILQFDQDSNLIIQANKDEELGDWQWGVTKYPFFLPHNRLAYFVACLKEGDIRINEKNLG